MKDKRMLLTFRNGETKAIPVAIVADNRAKYYSEKDENTTYEEEYNFVMNDDYEAVDWFTNNMDWKDVEAYAVDVDQEGGFDYQTAVLQNQFAVVFEEVNDYDSRKDTKKHIAVVQEFIKMFTDLLHGRAMEHDMSKLQSPEREVFDEVTPKLKELEYGTAEYKATLEEMGMALEHHYKHNRHHPEHFENGIKDMNIIDLIEMMCDWNAARLRHDKIKTFDESLEINKKRFNIPDDIVRLLKNTNDYIQERMRER